MEPFWISRNLAVKTQPACAPFLDVAPWTTSRGWLEIWRHGQILGFWDRFVMLFGRDHVLHTWDFILARDVWNGGKFFAQLFTFPDGFSYPFSKSDNFLAIRPSFTSISTPVRPKCLLHGVVFPVGNKEDASISGKHYYEVVSEDESGGFLQHILSHSGLMILFHLTSGGEISFVCLSSTSGTHAVTFKLWAFPDIPLRH